ncbi:MAG: YitT family protein [Oscillospiraceae bacterium]|jgi:uncharacterized membrane-anchored protein YitT (DUF2179 family)|nr:YitT family protein [Oscillospiraceae bacterium]
MKIKHPILKQIYTYVLIFIGTIIAAASIEVLLIPNGLMDGGVVGISIMVSHLLGIPLGILTFALNIPFLIIGYKQIGKSFLVQSVFAIASFSVWVEVLKLLHLHPIENDPILAAIFGGVVLGAGIGIIIRYGASLDGTEMMAIIISRVTQVSVGQCVLLFNVVIFTVAGFVFGPSEAMYSLLTYFIASKVMDIVVEGLDEAKCIMIVSERYEDVASAISARLGRGVTFLDGEGSYLRRRVKVIYVVVTRIEISKLKSIIIEKDPNAFLTISNVADVLGGSHKKKSIH